ncbi:LysM peptidoglycan-binding domain-containing protein [Candidatus Daviesbacteria bacterium]|nr:LysM peptidoglycan-binding domain-containing protein [Candidatus Daviesbacteria bacterium]
MAKKISTGNYLNKIESEIQSNQSKLSMILGGLIILVVGFLVFNYFNKNKSDIGPAQSTTSEEQNISPDKLPGKYTVAENDTLFEIAQKYYNDGYKYPEIAKANNLSDPDSLEKGQVLEIPKLEGTTLSSPSPKTEISETTEWGPKITTNTYTVTEDDWLSKIAGRAYGDVYAFERIAKANNISNPDLIEAGMTLTIPR